MRSGRYVRIRESEFSSRTCRSRKCAIAVDVANGAAYKSTPCILRELGAEVIVAHDQPNGTNINADCGSTYPESEIQRIVRKAARRLESRTMATPIGCCFATKMASWSMATKFSRLPRSILLSSRSADARTPWSPR